MYPEELLTGMRQELTSIGFRELRTAQDVDATLQKEKRTVLVVVNSVCGCAAAGVMWSATRRSPLLLPREYSHHPAASAQMTCSSAPQVRTPAARSVGRPV